MNLRTFFPLLPLGLLLGACADDQRQPLDPRDQIGMLALSSVEWNLKKIETGTVSAIAELGEDVAVFSDRGALFFGSGQPIGTDNTVTSFRTAAVIPAGDLSGEWIAAVDGAGKVYRIRNRNLLEEISDRYGLAGAQVQHIANLGKGRTGFSISLGSMGGADKLAVADGKVVTRFDGAFPNLVGGGGQAASVKADEVRLFEPVTGTGKTFALPGTVAAAFDPAGTLIVATKNALYADTGEPELRQIYRIRGAEIHALASTPNGVWVGLGDTVALLSGGQLRKAGGAPIPKGARLVGTATGDVWHLANGKLGRLAETGGDSADRELWKRGVLPMFTRLCSICHLPGGSAQIDLSTYSSWQNNRELIYLRVVQGKPTPMPPAGVGTLTAEELDALRKWLGK